MSWPALKWALMKRLPAPQKSTLIALARRQPDNLNPFACKTDTLGDEAGLSRAGVKLATAGLTAKLLINVQRSKRYPPIYSLQLASSVYDVTGYEVTGHQIASERSPGDHLSGYVVTTNKHKKQTPKDKDSSSRSRVKEKTVDPRYQEFVSAMQTYWQTLNPTLPFKPIGRDFTALKAFMWNRPSLDVKNFQIWLTNRIKSEGINTAEEFHAWLPSLAKYAAGPLNRYQQPLGDPHGTRNQQQYPGHAAQNRTDRIADAAAGAYQNLTRGIGQSGSGSPH